MLNVIENMLLKKGTTVLAGFTLNSLYYYLFKLINLFDKVNQATHINVFQHVTYNTFNVQL